MMNNNYYNTSICVRPGNYLKYKGLCTYSYLFKKFTGQDLIQLTMHTDATEIPDSKIDFVLNLKTGKMSEINNPDIYDDVFDVVFSIPISYEMFCGDISKSSFLFKGKERYVIKSVLNAGRFKKYYVIDILTGINLYSEIELTVTDKNNNKLSSRMIEERLIDTNMI